MFERLVVDVRNPDVELVRGEFPENFNRGRLGLVDRDRRVFARKRRGQVRDDRVGRRDHPYPQATLQRPARRVQLLFEADLVREHSPRPAQYDLAVGGEPAEAVAALDDRRAEVVLELAQRRRERRLGDAATLRRTCEVPFGRERGEVLELPDQHGAAILW